MRITSTLVQRLCRRCYVSMLCSSRVGVKCANPLITNDLFEYCPQGQTKVLPVTSLHLWIDGLKDDYTLLGRRITHSPHLHLMEILSKRGDVRESEYVTRARQGTLGLAPSAAVDREYLETLCGKFDKAGKALESGDYEPIRIATVAGSCFIIDGADRAAICALRSIDPKCTDVSPVVYDSFYWWVYRKMLRRKSEYSKHIEHFAKLMGVTQPGP